MLVRGDDSGTLLIGQPSHAWIAGQLARAWGNAQFGALDPYEEVCLAAEQHDIGMAEWDLAPTLNPDTGLPHSFIEMPISAHLPLWREAPRRLLRQSRYATLLTSMHGVRLYGLRDLDRLPPEDAASIRAYMDGQRAWQAELTASLGADADEIARNSQLVWTWDYMSLALCLGWPPCAVADVPTASEPVSVAMRPGSGPGQVIVDPWPFRDAEAFTVRCEGQRLTERVESAEALSDVLAAAPWETLEVELAPTGRNERDASTRKL
jgi:hypothetical protein